MAASQSQLRAQRMYFGYGSNLWREQMALRCSSSTYQGIGRLSGHRWIINGRGYANVVPSKNAKDVVYGLIYDLTPDDESALDVNEGVPFAYTKEMLGVDFWASKDSSCPIDVTREGRKCDMLIYIDRERTEDDKPREEYILREEYIFRMNMGIKDGIEAGIPKDYVDRVLRPFVPEVGRKEVEEMARKQALSFEDEK